MENIYNRKHLELDEEKNKNHWNLFAYLLIAGTILTASLILPLKYLEKRDQKFLEENRCSPVYIIATKEDTLRGYKGLAKKTIKNPKVNLGKVVGIDRLTERIAEMNQNNQIIEGQKYKTYKCEGCTNSKL